jgi:hypothetical protein
MISRNHFDRLSDRDKFLFLFDEVAQMRLAGGTNAANLEAVRKQLEELLSKRPDAP